MSNFIIFNRKYSKNNKEIIINVDNVRRITEDSQGGTLIHFSENVSVVVSQDLSSVAESLGF